MQKSLFSSSITKFEEVFKGIKDVKSSRRQTMSVLSKSPVFRRFSLSVLLGNYLLGSLTDNFLMIEIVAVLKTSDVWSKRMFPRNLYHEEI